MTRAFAGRTLRPHVRSLLAATCLAVALPAQALDAETAQPDAAGPVAFFSAERTVAGAPRRELWRTDGTRPGTARVTDRVIFPWAERFGDSRAAALPDGRMVFAGALNPGGPTALWVTDGTRAGTRQLPADVTDPFSFIELSPGTVAFLASGRRGTQLWTTDGTAAGTTLAVRPRWLGGSAARMTPLGDGRALFAAYGIDPYVTDGTSAGTFPLYLGCDGRSAFLGPFAPLGDGRALFSCGGGSRNSLFVTDGTVNGTRKLAHPHTGREVLNAIGIVTIEPGRAVLRARMGNLRAPLRLWVTDGTFEGTQDITPNHLVTRTAAGVALGDGRAVFGARSSDSGSLAYLWVTDGTRQGTRIVVRSDETQGPVDPTDFHALGDGRALFRADGHTGTGDGVEAELWITDGTREGTYMVRNINPEAGSFPAQFAPMGDGRALFSADDGVRGREPWITDGTQRGTRPLRDINRGPGGSDPRGFTLPSAAPTM